MAVRSANPFDGARVLIISSDEDTIDGTFQYLSRVGASPQSAMDTGEAIGAAATADAVVFFADDYAKESAIWMLAQIRRGLAKVVIVVSDQVEAFASVENGEESGAVTILRRPTWAWMILDAIRSQMRPEGVKLSRQL